MHPIPSLSTQPLAILGRHALLKKIQRSYIFTFRLESGWVKNPIIQSCLSIGLDHCVALCNLHWPPCLCFDASFYTRQCFLRFPHFRSNTETTPDDTMNFLAQIDMMGSLRASQMLSRLYKMDIPFSGNSLSLYSSFSPTQSKSFYEL